MKPIARALDDATRQLSQTSDTARLDAELLMAEALHIDRDRLLLSPPDRQVPERFREMVKRRSEGEPVAYITGRAPSGISSSTSVPACSCHAPIPKC